MTSATARTLILTVLTVVEIVVLLVLLARWYGRRWGWRGSTRRLRHFLLDTFTDLLQPLLVLIRFQQSARILQTHLSDPQLTELLNAATDLATACAGDSPDARTYAAIVTSSEVAVAVADSAPLAVKAPWQHQDGWWWTSRNAVPPSREATATPTPRYVAVGATLGGAVLIDLVRAPGVLTISGDDRAASSLLCAIAAQLSAGRTVALDRPDGLEREEVLITDGVHRAFDGPPLQHILTGLEHRPASGRTSDHLTVVVCGRPPSNQWQRMVDLVTDRPFLRIVALEPYAGPRWRLEVSALGEVSAPHLGIEAYSAPLERAVARTLRSAQLPAAPSPSAVPTSRPDPVLRYTGSISLTPGATSDLPPDGPSTVARDDSASRQHAVRRDDLAEPDLSPRPSVDARSAPVADETTATDAAGQIGAPTTASERD